MYWHCYIISVSINTMQERLCHNMRNVCYASLVPFPRFSHMGHFTVIFFWWFQLAASLEWTMQVQAPNNTHGTTVTTQARGLRYLEITRERARPFRQYFCTHTSRIDTVRTGHCTKKKWPSSMYVVNYFTEYIPRMVSTQRNIMYKNADLWNARVCILLAPE